jgi:Zn-dependent protease with chaperone function
VDGREIVVVAGAAPIAFCSGLLRPRIFVSQGALRRLSAAELLAVVAHESHHADRRDPLRLLIGRALASLLALDESGHGSVAGVTPERVDNLLGELAEEHVPRALLVLTGLCLGALSFFAFLLLTVPEHPEMPVGAAPPCLATVYVIAGPAWLASRRFRQRLPAAPGAP